jgi:hypothetical protein
VRAKQVGGALLLVACVLFVIAAFARSWYSVDGQAGGLGLTGMTLHDDYSKIDSSYARLMEIQEKNRKAEWSELDDTPEMKDFRIFMWSGRVAFALVLLAGIAAGLTFIKLLMGQVSQYAFVRIAAAFAALSSIVFRVAMTDDMSKFASFGTTFYLFWGAVILGGVGESALSRGPMTAQTPTAQGLPWQQPSAPQAPPQACPACTSCRAPTTFVTEYGRFFCSRCNLYI